jgi:hypothetical protein
MATDDDVLRAYEQELRAAPPRSNRGFWIVAGAMLVAVAFLLVQIFANRPLANAIANAQAALRRAQAAAEIELAREGDFLGADADGLSEDLPGLSFRPADEPSAGPNDVSVFASSGEWAAAVQARAGACFYLRLVRGDDPRYGAGTECSGEAALGANEPRW